MISAVVRRTAKSGKHKMSVLFTGTRPMMGVEELVTDYKIPGGFKEIITTRQLSRDDNPTTEIIMRKRINMKSSILYLPKIALLTYGGPQKNRILSATIRLIFRNDRLLKLNIKISFYIIFTYENIHFGVCECNYLNGINEHRTQK